MSFTGIPSLTLQKMEIPLEVCFYLKLHYNLHLLVVHVYWSPSWEKAYTRPLRFYSLNFKQKKSIQEFRLLVALV